MGCSHCLGRILRKADRLPQLEAPVAPPPVRVTPVVQPGIIPDRRNPFSPGEIRPLPGDPNKGPAWTEDEPRTRPPRRGY